MAVVVRIGLLKILLLFASTRVEILVAYPMSKSLVSTTGTELPSRATASASQIIQRVLIGVVVAAAIGVTVVLVWLSAYGDAYTPGSTVGYNLGLVGSIMMLTLLLYPVRKRVSTLERAGSMVGWFRYHMVFGILGPVLVLFHSTFKVESMNARVAFYSMIVVLISGIVGRFVYRQVHIGLYGQEQALADAEAELETSSANLKLAFVMYPEILDRLKRFRDAAFEELDSWHRRAWRFLTLRVSAALTAHATKGAVRAALTENAKQNNWTKAQLNSGYGLAKHQVNRYVVAVCKAARYSTWQYILSLWHLFHVPFLYVLVFSAIAHVIAVHMY
jgi:hypothetical protein